MNERATSLAAAAQALNAACGRPTPFALAFLTDRARIADPARVARGLPACSALILRDYDQPDRVALARDLQAIAGARGLFLLVGGDAALAARVGAGLHLRSDQLAAPPERHGAVLTASCHSAAELARAAEIGADLALFGPVFPTRSHPGARALGAAAFKALAAASPVPVLAIGGVDASNAASLAGRNVAGFAAIGAFAQGG